MPVAMVLALVDQTQIKVFAMLNQLTVPEIIRVSVDIYQCRPRCRRMAVRQAQTVPKVVRPVTS